MNNFERTMDIRILSFWTDSVGKIIISRSVRLVMRASDEHLEQALKEYNDKISALEVNGTDDELLEALVNRSTILMLLG